MPPVSYCNMIKSKDKGFVYGVRLQMVRDALEKGIKPAMRAYGVSRNTVRKWLRRYQDGGTTGMVERSRAPHHIPHKKGKEVEEEVLSHRESKPGWGARMLSAKAAVVITMTGLKIKDNWHFKKISRKKKKKV